MPQFWKLEVQDQGGSENPLLYCRLLHVSSHGGRGVRDLSGTSFIIAPISFKGLCPYNLKTLLPNTITLGVSLDISTYTFWGDTNTQTTGLWPSLANEREVEVCAFCGFCGNVFFTDKRAHDTSSQVWNSDNNWDENLRKKGSILRMAGWKYGEGPESGNIVGALN